MLVIGVLALQSSGDTWPHLIANVLPGAVRRTLALMAGVTLLIGTGTAWLVTMELPANLLLRLFNFDTLATQVFTLASLYRYEEAGLSALTIVVASLAPVLLLHGIIVAGCPGP